MSNESIGMPLSNSARELLVQSDSQIGDLVNAAHEQQYTTEVARLTEHIYERVRPVIPKIEWPVYAPYVAAINALKRRCNAIVLAHNYQTPEIFHGVADYVGDSLSIAQEAAKTNADIIVLCGVLFMAETAKILNPKSTVLIPDPLAGCSLATSITPDDVRELRERYPRVPVVAYINTSAAVKAESDICCTSANATQVVESLKTDRVILIPDEYLAKYVASRTQVEIIPWWGHCEVHERFTVENVNNYREEYKDIQVIAHPECPPEVLAVSDFVGSTSEMIKHVRENKPRRVVMITECSMSDNVVVEFPEIEFMRPCNLCPHMKRITLPKILASLETAKYEVTIDMTVADRARYPLERMITSVSSYSNRIIQQN